MTNGLTCRELAEFLADYLAGELSESERDRFEAHLRICPACAAYVGTYREAIRLGRLAWAPESDPVLPTDVPEGLVRAILAARSAGSFP